MNKPKTFRPWQPEQTTLLPPSPRDWLSDDHQVYFLLDLIDDLDWLRHAGLRPDSRYFFQQVDVAALCTAIHDWTLAQFPGGATDLDQLVCDGKTLRGSIEPTPGDGSAFIAQVTLYSAALGVSISQACYATGENHERAVLRQLLGELELEGVLIQADALHTQRPFFDSCRSRGPTSS